MKAYASLKKAAEPIAAGSTPYTLSSASNLASVLSVAKLSYNVEQDTRCRIKT